MLKYLITLFSVFITLNTLGQGDWKEEYNADGLIVFTRKVAESDYKEYKGIIEADADLHACYELLSDASRFHTFMYSVADIRLLEQVSDSIFDIYYEINFPWPLSNKYNIFQHQFKKEGQFVFMNVEQLKEYQVDTDVEEMEGTNYTYWILEDLGNSRTKITHGSRSEGADMPAWLVNMFIVEAPKNTLKDFRTEVEKDE